MKEPHTMKIFFNSILINELSGTTRSNLDKIAIMYKNMQNSKHLQKFPSLYLQFFENYNIILLRNKEVEFINDKEQVFNNLINISNVRKLTEEEEK